MRLIFPMPINSSFCSCRELISGFSIWWKSSIRKLKIWRVSLALKTRLGSKWTKIIRKRKSLLFLEPFLTISTRKIPINNLWTKWRTKSCLKMLELKLKNKWKEKEDNLREPSLRSTLKLYCKYLGLNQLKKLRILLLLKKSSMKIILDWKKSKRGFFSFWPSNLGMEIPRET